MNLKTAPCFPLSLVIALGLVAWLACQSASAQVAGANAPEKMPLKPVSPGVFELGKVRLDKNRQTVSFPALVNMREANIEYLVVTASGKMHESIFRTDAEPYHIQLALLLLGAKGAGTNDFPADKTEPLPGDSVSVEVVWASKGKSVRRRGEDFVYNLETKSAMSQGAWTYNGSRMYRGTFLAQQDGSIISVMVDADALINNPRPGRENDKIWLANTNALPPLNSPVEVVVTLKSSVK